MRQANLNCLHRPLIVDGSLTQRKNDLLARVQAINELLVSYKTQVDPKELVCALYGTKDSPGFFEFLETRIFQRGQCEKYIERASEIEKGATEEFLASIEPVFRRIFPETDLDTVILRRFQSRVALRIQDRVIDSLVYGNGIVPMLLERLEDISKDVEPADAASAKLTLMRFAYVLLNTSIESPGAVKQRQASCPESIRKVCDAVLEKSSDLALIKLASEILTTAATRPQHGLSYARIEQRVMQLASQGQTLVRQALEGKALSAPTELSVRIRLTHAKQPDAKRDTEEADGDGFFFAVKEAEEGPKTDENDLLQSRQAVQAEKKGEDDKATNKKPEDLQYVDAKVTVGQTDGDDLAKSAENIFADTYNKRRGELLQKYPAMSERMPELEAYLKDTVRQSCHKNAVAWIEGALLAHKHSAEQMLASSFAVQRLVAKLSTDYRLLRADGKTSGDLMEDMVKLAVELMKQSADKDTNAFLRICLPQLRVLTACMRSCSNGEHQKRARALSFLMLRMMVMDADQKCDDWKLDKWYEQPVEEEDETRHQSTLLIDVLRQIDSLALEEDISMDSGYKLTHASGKIKLSPWLLTNEQFRHEIWALAYPAYTILSSISKQDRLSADLLPSGLQKHYSRVKKELESLSQSMLLKKPTFIEPAGEKGGRERAVFVHEPFNLSGARMLIRTSWIVDAPAAGQQPGDDANLKRLLGTISSLVTALMDKQAVRAAHTEAGAMLEPAERFPIAGTAHFALTKIVQEKNVAGASENYYTHVVESALFKSDLYQRILELPPLPDSESDDEGCAADNLLKMLVFTVCGRMFANEPPIVSRFADSGQLRTLVQCILAHKYPLRPGIQNLLVALVSSMANMEKGRVIIKEAKLLEHVITLPFDANKFKIKLVNYVTIPSPVQRDFPVASPASTGFAELIRNSDESFLDVIQRVLPTMFGNIRVSATALKRICWEVMQRPEFNQQDEASSTYSLQLAGFTESIMQSEAYFTLKLELDKIHAICACFNFQSNALLRKLYVLFLHPNVLEALFDTFELIAAIEPALSQASKHPNSTYGKEYKSFYDQYRQMLIMLLYGNSSGNLSANIIKVEQAFYKRVQLAIKKASQTLRDSFEALKPTQEYYDKLFGASPPEGLRSIDMLELFRASRTVITDPNATALQKEARWNMIERLQIAGFYCAVLEGSSKETQNSLFSQINWHAEITDLMAIIDIEQRATYQIQKEFLNNVSKHVDSGICAQKTIDLINTPFKKGVSTSEVSAYKKAHAEVQSQLDAFRHGIMGYPSYVTASFQKLLRQMVKYYSGRGAGDQNKNFAVLTKQSLIRLFKERADEALTWLTEAKNIDYDSPQSLGYLGCVANFVIGVISAMEQGELGWIGFYHFVRGGYLDIILRIFRFFRDLNTQPYVKGEARIGVNALDIMQSTCEHLRTLMTALVKFRNPASMLGDQVFAYKRELHMSVMDEDAVYESVQDFCINYLYTILKGCLMEESSSSLLVEQNSDISLPHNFYKNKDLRAIQTMIMEEVGSRFSRCRYLDGDAGAPHMQKFRWVESMVPEDGEEKKEEQKPKKLHRDPEVLSQIVSMGFDVELGRRAIKMTGDVQQALNLILSGDYGAIDGVSDSEDEEHQLRAAERKAEESRLREQEAEKRKAQSESKTNLRKSKIKAEEFFKLVQRLQREGIEVVQAWSHFDAAQVKRVPISKQQKYYKFYESYMLKLAQQPDRGEELMTVKVDALNSLVKFYKSKIQESTDLLPDSDEAMTKALEKPDLFERHLIFFSETKVWLYLINRFSRVESIRKELKKNKGRSGFDMKKLCSLVHKTLKRFIAPKASDLLFPTEPKDPDMPLLKMFERVLKANVDPRKVYAYLVALFEFLYRHLQVFLLYQQSLISKQQKNEATLEELKRFGLAERPERKMDVFNQPDEKQVLSKMKGYEQAFEELDSRTLATDIQTFVRGVRTLMVRLVGGNGEPRRLSNNDRIDAEDLIAKIQDLSRIILVQEMPQKKEVAAPAPAPLMNLTTSPDCSGGQLLMTGCSTQLQILLAQKHAFDQPSLERHFGYLIERVLLFRARRKATHARLKAAIDARKDGDEEQVFKITDHDLKIEQKDTQLPLNILMEEMSKALLGIGKLQLTTDSHGAHGQQNFTVSLSYPSNEPANTLFRQMLHNAVKQVCDVHVKKPKTNEGEKLKPDQLKKMQESATVMLKKEKLEKADIEPCTDDKALLELYDKIFAQLRQSAQAWENELNEYEAIKPKKIERIEADLAKAACGPPSSHKNWQAMSMAAARTLSSMSRLYFFTNGGITAKLLESVSAKSLDNLADWFARVYLPLRLVLRTTTANVDDDQSRLDITYDLISLEKLQQPSANLDRNLCLFLNELTGYGHVYPEAVRNQRKRLRKHLLVCSLESLSELTSQREFKSQRQPLLVQARILAALFTLQHLISQYNLHEFNRVLISRECYAWSLRELFMWQEQGTDGRKFMALASDVMDIVVKWPKSTFGTILVERFIAIYSAVAVYLEAERKRESKLKEDWIRRAKMKKKGGDKEGEQEPKDGSDKSEGGGDSGPDHGGLPVAEPNEQEQLPEADWAEGEDVRMDDDALPQVENEQPPQYDDDEEEDEDLEQQPEEINQNILHVDDEEGVEDEDEELAEDLMLEELEDMEQEQLESDEEDSGDDQYWRANIMGRGRYRPAAQRDILNAIAPQRRPQFMPPDTSQSRDAWSEAEEQVSQILRNLRGLSLHQNSERQSYLDNERSQLPNMAEDTARYAIELDVLPQYSAPVPFFVSSRADAARRPTLEEIKEQQRKATNNGLSSLFQIVKPLSQQQIMQLASGIERGFQEGMSDREAHQMKKDQEEARKAIEREDLPEGDSYHPLFIDDSDFEDDRDLRREERYGARPPNVGRYSYGYGAGLQDRVNELHDLQYAYQDAPERLHSLQQQIRHFLGSIERDEPGAFEIPLPDLGRGLPVHLRMEPPDDRYPGGFDRPFGMFREEVPFPGGPGRDQLGGGGGYGNGFFEAQPPDVFRPREPQPADLQLNMIQQLIDNDQAVVEEIEAPEPQLPGPRRASVDIDMAAQAQDEGSNDEEDQSGDEDNDNSENDEGSSASGSNADAQQQPQPAAAENVPADQALLSSFFGSLNQPPAPQQPPQPQPVPPVAAPEEGKQEEPAQQEQPVAEAQPIEEQKEQQPAQEVSSLLPGGEANQEQQPAQEANEAPAQQQPQPEISSLLVDAPPEDAEGLQVVGQPQPEAPAEEQKDEVPEESKAEEVNAEQPAEEDEDMTFGYPNSLLIANDIAPAVLECLPEETRAEVLSQIQDQFDAWQAARVAQQQEREAAQNQSAAEENADQPEQPQPQPAAEGENQAPAQDGQDAAAADQQQQQQEQQPAAENQPQPEAQAQIQEPPADPIVARALEMGMDPELVQSLPRDMIEELLQNNQMWADNLGNPPPNQGAQPAQAEGDMIADMINSTADPNLRREMLIQLSNDQAANLPQNLRDERRQLVDGLNVGAARMNQMNHIRDRIRDRERAERDRPYGGYGGLDNIFRDMRGEVDLDRILGQRVERVSDSMMQELTRLDLSGKPLDQIVVSCAEELDQDAQDKMLRRENKTANLIQEQLVEDTYQPTPEAGERQDRLLRNLLATICLNSNVRTDVMAFLRLFMKNREVAPGQPPVYIFRNKLINALCFILEIAAAKDKEALFQLFDIELAVGQLEKIKMSGLQWNRIFLVCVGVLRVLLESNRKLIMHMVNCLILKEKHFTGKGDHVLASHAKILGLRRKAKADADEQIDTNPAEQLSCGDLKPPLAILIEIMRHQSAEHADLQQAADKKEQLQETLIRGRNIKLLIQEIIKQFDMFFEKQVGAQTFSEISQDAVKSLTDLLFLTNIDKKLLASLGKFFYRMMDSTLMSKTIADEKDETAQEAKDRFDRQRKEDTERARANFLQITKQCQEIAEANIGEVQKYLDGIFDVALDLGLDMSALSMRRKKSSVVSNEEEKPKLTKDQEKQLKATLRNFSAVSSPMRHVLILYSQFFQYFGDNALSEAERIDECEKEMGRLKQQIEDAKAKQAELEVIEESKEEVKAEEKADEKKAAPEDETEEQAKARAEAAAKEREEKEAKKKADAEKQKKELADKERKTRYTEELVQKYEASITQKLGLAGELKKFYGSDGVKKLLQAVGDALQIMQVHELELCESTRLMINLTFQCYMPEMQEEVIRKAKAKQLQPRRPLGRKRKEIENLLIGEPKDAEQHRVSIEPVRSEEAELKALSEKQQAAKLSSGKKSSAVGKKASSLGRADSVLFRSGADDVSARLQDFNATCLSLKPTLNRIIKQVYGSQEERKQQQEAEAVARDLETVVDFIKYMPSLMDFENKRSYFKKELKSLKRRAQAPELHIQVSRADIFRDTFGQLNPLRPEELMGPMKITFRGEQGADWGGLLRDFFVQISRAMFDKSNALFVASDNGSSYMPNSLSKVQGPDHLRFFRFAGRVIGKAIMENCLLEAYFTRSMYKLMIGQRLCFKDLEDFDNGLYDGLNWCTKKESDAEGAVEQLYETFCVSLEEFGVEEVIDLKEGGRDIDVTNENKLEFVELKAFFHLYKNIQGQIDSFLQGFHEVIPLDLISIFNYKEVELLISGLPDYRIADLRKHTNYQGFTAQSQQIIWFWEYCETLNREEKGNLLQFVTGSSKVPVEGFEFLAGHRGPMKFTIVQLRGREDQMPQAHTCFNQLDIPNYPSKEMLVEKMTWALKESEGFGFA